MATVRDDQLRRYLEVFRDTYLETADNHVPAELTPLLLRYPLLSCKIVGYISTQLGAGFEYISQDDPEIDIKRSSSRIEDLFLDAPAHVRKLRTLAARLTNTHATFSDVRTTGLFPFRLGGNSSLRLAACWFSAFGWERAVEYAELYTDRTEEFWSERNAVARAKDDIYLALLDIQQSQARSVSLNEYLSNFKARHVLVLGDYNPDGRRRLEAIKEALGNLGYVPLLLDEISDDLQYDLRQKAATVGSVVRFVVVEDSTPSGHLVELGDARSHDWVTIVLREEGASSTFMTLGISQHSNEIIEREYTDGNLAEVLAQGVSWAEGRLDEMQQAFASQYPWRKNG